MSRSSNVRKIIIEMFNQRGYSDIDDSEDNRVLATKLDGNQVCAFSTIIEKLNVAEIHNYIAQLQKANISHGLLVFEGIPTPAVKNVVTNTPDLMMNIELFQADDLQFNITEHRLVPKHIRLTKDETKEFKEKYGTDIPIIKTDDAVSRFYNFSKGEIIKIIRRDGFPSYRIVR
jgi:DNA-directed RNA polymerase subunit H (RpoH/RPB5)